MVEQSLPRLRDMFHSGGMNLLDVNVSHQRDGGRQQPDGSFTARPLHERFADAESAQVEMGLGAVPLGLVDFYA